MWNPLARLLGDTTPDPEASVEPIALVYRGPATLPGCPESAAEAVRAAGLRPEYVGPKERYRLTADTLATARLYVQPGGGDLDDAWVHVQDAADVLRGWVAGGGAYLGFCLGAYLAGDDPGFGLLPGHVDQYVVTRGASVRDEGDHVVTLDWAGTPRSMYFQDGAYVDVPRRAARRGAEVVATYDNGRAAAVVADYGRGRVGVVGPHPEATLDWYVDAGLVPPTPLATDLAVDLVRRTLAPAGALR